MRHYKAKDYRGEYSVSEGVPFEALVRDVIEEYKKIHNNAMPSREMAEEIVDLRIVAYQEGGGWFFTVPRPTEGTWAEDTQV